MPSLVRLDLTARQAEFIKRLLDQTILDTASNKTARACEAILAKLSQARTAEPEARKSEASQ